MSHDRPVCVTVIGWGTIAVATLMVFSGAMAFYISASIGDVSARSEGRDLFDFVFDHFGTVAVLQAALGVLLVLAGRSLLLLRRWASRVIQGVSWLLLLYSVSFTGVLGYELVGAAQEARSSASPVGVVAISVMMACNLAVWGIPLILTIRSLGSERVQKVLA